MLIMYIYVLSDKAYTVIHENFVVKKFSFHQK